MKSLKNYWMIAVMAILGTMGFTSCSSDEGGNGGQDFIEVTIDGKTYREDVYGIYSLIRTKNDLVVCYSTEDVFSDRGLGVFYGLTMPESEEEILDSSTGSYRAVEDFRGDVRNFDFTLDLEYYDTDDYFYVLDGKHKVTSIRKVDGGVQIEGTFDLVMENDYSYEEKSVKGKYRITTEAYYSYDDEDEF